MTLHRRRSRQVERFRVTFRRFSCLNPHEAARHGRTERATAKPGTDLAERDPNSLFHQPRSESDINVAPPSRRRPSDQWIAVSTLTGFGSDCVVQGERQVPATHMIQIETPVSAQISRPGPVLRPLGLHHDRHLVDFGCGKGSGKTSPFDGTPGHDGSASPVTKKRCNNDCQGSEAPRPLPERHGGGRRMKASSSPLVGSFVRDRDRQLVGHARASSTDRPDRA